MSHSATRSWMILLGLTLGVCVTNGFARFAYGLILPSMRESLHWTYAQAGWINTANALGYVVGSVAAFALIYRVPSTRLFSLGMIGTAVFLLATGLSEDFILLSLWRILTGIFGAVAFIAGGALAAALFPEDARRNALAIAFYFGIGGGFGMVLSGAVFPTMFDAYGAAVWPVAWVLMGAASIAFLPLCLWASESLTAPVRQQSVSVPLPVAAMLPQIAAYMCFGLGYIVYVTFIVAMMKHQAAGPGLVSAVWVVTGFGIMASPFVWRAMFARYASGLPLAAILLTLAVGTGLAVLVPTTSGLIASAVLFGLSVFMAPGAVTNFSRKNLPKSSWGAAVSLFTIIFAVGQTIGPVAAGYLGDLTGDIGLSLLCAGGILLLGTAIALTQKPLA